MALVKDMTEARKIAAIEYNMKMMFERSFLKPLRRYLRDLSKDFKASYSKRASFDTSLYNPELSSILKVHYRRVSNAFKFSLRSSEYKDLLDHDINLNIKDYIDNHAPIQASIINQTNQLEFDRYIADAIALIAQSNNIIDNKELALLASKQFDEHIIPKSNLISTTETQNSAESTKDIEENTIRNNAITAFGILGITRVYDKTWVASLDNRTRHAHAKADGQRVPIDQPFIVKDELLMYPGDVSLNATLNNIINCRCASVLISQ